MNPIIKKVQKTFSRFLHLFVFFATVCLAPLASKKRARQGATMPTPEGEFGARRGLRQGATTHCALAPLACKKQARLWRSVSLRETVKSRAPRGNCRAKPGMFTFTNGRRRTWRTPSSFARSNDTLRPRTARMQETSKVRRTGANGRRRTWRTPSSFARSNDTLRRLLLARD